MILGCSPCLRAYIQEQVKTPSPTGRVDIHVEVKPDGTGNVTNAITVFGAEAVCLDHYLDMNQAVIHGPGGI